MSTTWGTGTMFYGETDFNPRDGSYITTKWLTLMYLPIIPLCTYRIWPSEQKTELVPIPLAILRTMKYESIPIEFCWRQILKTYSWGLPILALVVFLLSLIIRETG